MGKEPEIDLTDIEGKGSLINRESIKSEYKRCLSEQLILFEKFIDNISPIQNSGYWKILDKSCGYTELECSCCNHIFFHEFGGFPLWKYCPNCGKEMDLTEREV